MGITVKNSNHNKIINFLMKHYMKRLKKYLKKLNYAQAEKWVSEYRQRFQRYMNDADFGPQDGKFTSYLNMYSGLAAYEILRENGFTQEEGIKAYDYMCIPMRKIAATMHRFMDCYSDGFQRVVKSLNDDMNGPKSICWETEIVENSNQKYEYKIHKCLYFDVCKEHGFPEFTQVFCNHDHYAFDVLHRHVKFERIGAIGDGDKCCHDIFYKVDKS